MKSNLLFLLVFFFFKTVNGGNSITANNKKAKPDTTTYKINEEVLMDIEDSALFFPANGFYSKWDTLNIHPYNFDLTKTCDTVPVVLNDPKYCGYAHPCSGEITSDFGYRKYLFHYGIDIRLKTGDSVLCAFEGKVRIAKKSRTYGNVIVVRHNNGLETLYAHLSKINVEIGQQIDAGQLIGLGGSTGRSTGSHLHFEIRFKGQPINPNDLISFKNYSLVADTISICKKNFEYLIEVRKIKYHNIRRGDTLSGIALKYGTTTSKLCKLNGIKKTTVLKIGRKIRYC